jgi:pyruvate formate lyase activating enzyme
MSGRTAADALRVGGLQPFTTIDFPGALAAVVFVQGCPWRCLYCHNPHLQAADPAAAGGPNWAELRPWLERRRRVLDAIVFSGGEPTLDPALPAALREVRALGYRSGLHTAGMAPRRLQAVLPLLDWVGLDVKAPLDDDALHDRISGVRGAAREVRESLQALLASGVAHEVRTTTHASLLHGGPKAALLRLAVQLRGAGAARLALQACRPPATANGADAGDATLAWPDAELLQAVRAHGPDLLLRPAA